VDALFSDKPSFDAAYPDIARQVRRVVHRLRMAHPRELADVTHEALIAVAAAWPGYDPALPLRPWIAVIVRRLMAPRREGAGPEPPADLLDQNALDPEEQARVEARRERLLALLRPVDEDRRIVFILKEFDGFTMTEIAEMLGVPLGAAYRRLEETWEEITDRLDALGEEERDVTAWLVEPAEARRRRMSFS
jgi:RNA polymerase sigma factor (sigma-70 family)